MTLSKKIEKTKNIIKEVVEKEGLEKVAVSFSGGKDSTVLLHIARQIYPDIKAYFSNTTNEDKRILQFIKTVDNLKIVTPKLSFSKIIKEYGYPLISKEVCERLNRIFRTTYIKKQPTKSDFYFIKVNRKIPSWTYPFFDINMINMVEKNYKKFVKDIGLHKHFENLINEWYTKSRQVRLTFGLKDSTKIKLHNICCDKLKKDPLKKINKTFLIGILTEESQLRATLIKKYGYWNENKVYPIYFWTEKDIWEYINTHNLQISKAYETETRTGCVLCGFGAHREFDRIERAKEYQPKRIETLLSIKNKDSDITFGEALEFQKYCWDLKGNNNGSKRLF